jgi:hypothetical protein
MSEETKQSPVQGKARSNSARYIRERMLSFVNCQGECNFEGFADYFETVAAIQSAHEKKFKGSFFKSHALAAPLCDVAKKIRAGDTAAAITQTKALLPIVIWWVAFDPSTKVYGDMS